MEEIERERETGHTPQRFALVTPPARLREPSADDLTIDVRIRDHMPLDDSERLSGRGSRERLGVRGQQSGGFNDRNNASAGMIP